MAWTAPMTAIAKTGFSDVEYNRYIRDNLLTTAPALATATGQTFVASGVNTIAASVFTQSTVATSQTTTSTSYANLATVGPTITVTPTGTEALSWYAAKMSNSTANASCSASVLVTGGVNIPASNSTRIMIDGRPTTEPSRVSGFRRWTGLKAGKSHTFTLKYAVSAGTGTFVDRCLVVWPL